MGFSGPGVLDNDDAWDFVASLLEVGSATRAEYLIAALERVRKGRVGLEESSGALVAAMLVAEARSPKNFPDERSRLVDHADRVADVSGFDALVGEVRPLRTAKVAQLALSAVQSVRMDSELADLWEDQADFEAVLSSLTDALRSPVGRLAVDSRSRAKSSPLRRGWRPGTLLSVDLGDGFQSWAQMLVQPFVAFYGARVPSADPLPSTAEIVNGPVLFTVKVNPYLERPGGWRTIGAVPDPEQVPPVPSMFWQDDSDPEICRLISAADEWNAGVPASLDECIGLENARVAGWHPEHCEQRLRNHHEGRPDPLTENLALQIPRSWARVSSLKELDDAHRAGRFPAPVGEDSSMAFYPVEWVPHFAAGYGPGRDDLIVLEVDEARLPTWVNRGPVLPEEPASPRVPWTFWITERAIIGRYALTPVGDGYELARPWMPIYP